MSLLNKLSVPVIVAGTLASPVQAGNSLYDDFSTGFDAAKWAIRQDPASQPLTERYGITEHETFFAKNETDLADRRTILSLIGHTFNPGEILEYDVIYNEGSGDRAMGIFVNGGPLDQSGAGTIPYGGGSIGHNEQDLAAGNELGTNHVSINFQSDGLQVKIRRPDNTKYSEFFQNTNFSYAGNNYTLSSPFEVGFETWSKNGSINAEYDNFNIRTVPLPASSELAAAGIVALGSMRHRPKNYSKK